METIVYLVRHAEAEGNVYRRCHGQYDSLLTPRGLLQLPHLAKRFAPVPLDAVYASDLYRARMTANAIAKPKGLAVQLRPALREIDMGEWEDKTWAELPRLHPDAFHQWQTTPWACTVPGGESVLQAGGRMYDEVKKLTRAHSGKSIAVVTHGSAIRGALCLAMGLPPENMPDIGWGDNTCVAKLAFEDDTVSVIYWNDASHLPESLSTFAALGWTDNKAAPSSSQIWFKPVNLDIRANVDTLLRFAQQKYQSAYGSTAGLHAENYIADTRRMIEKKSDSVCFGMLDESPVALVRLDVCDESQPDTGMVGSFVIDEPYRGCGLSQQIIGQAISVYRALGKEYLCAYVAENNERAKSFYRKFGFSVDGEYRNALGNHYRMLRRIHVDAPES